MHCRMFSSNSGFYMLDTIEVCTTLPTKIVIIENVSRYCYMSSTRNNHPNLRFSGSDYKYCFT